MRVGIVGPVAIDTFADNLLSALAQLGVDAVALGGIREERNPYVRRAAEVLARGSLTLDLHWQNKIVRAAARHEVEFVISVQGSLLPRTVESLQSLGAKVCLWFPDAVMSLDRALMLLAPYDCVFFKEPLLVRRLNAMLDLPVRYLPEACNPAWHRPVVEHATEPHIAVVGTIHAHRVRLLERLLDARVPLRLYGPPLPRWVGASPLRSIHTGIYLGRLDKARAFRAAAGVLNPVHPTEVEGVNCRLFEAAASGATVLCEERAALHELFDVPSELLVYRNFDELVDSARWLLSFPAESTAMADAASRRAHAEHTYAHRLPHIFSVAASA